MSWSYKQYALRGMLLILLAAAGYWGWRQWWPEPVYQVGRTLRYGYTVSNSSNAVIENAEFWVYAPVKQTPTQRVIDLTANLPFEVQEDDVGNQVLHFRLPAMAPYAAKVITITAELELAVQPNRWSEPDDNAFILPERFIEADAPKIKATAEQLAAEQTDPNKKRFEWVAQHIDFSRYVREDLGALYALEQKKGDCTESAYLFTALARASGQPARAIGGFVYDRNAVLKAQDYHNWAEFYDGRTWRLSDPQNKVFDQNYDQYIAMRIITRAEDSLLDSSHRFAYSSPLLRVAMN